jgi:type II secretory pathway pseudopilin PulG
MKERRTCLGFTLVEAVLSLALVATGLLGVIYAFQSMSQSSLLADQTVTATNIARATIERIIARRDANGYASTLAAVSTSNTFDENPVTGFSGYVLNSSALEVDPDDDGNVDDFLDAAPGSGYARVTVQVSWNSGSNSISLVTLMANY